MSYIPEIEAAKRAADAASSKVDPRWTPEVQAEELAGIVARLTAKVNDLKEKGLADLDAKELAARARAHTNAAKSGPSTAEEWTLAGARRPFVAEHVAGLAPDEIVREYRVAGATGDRVFAWLLGREGLARLDAIRSDDKQPDALRRSAAKARNELATATGGPQVDAKLKEDLAGIAAERTALWSATLAALPAGPRPKLKF